METEVGQFIYIVFYLLIVASLQAYSVNLHARAVYVIFQEMAPCNKPAMAAVLPALGVKALRVLVLSIVKACSCFG